MFGTIAARYDLLNRALSLRRDVGWRREAARELPDDSAARVLDLCGGTGDLAIEIAVRRRAGWVVCCDFCHPMLARAEEKFRRRGLSERCTALEADGLHLPFPDGTFDGVTIAFGVRNFADMGAGLRESLRVLRPGGCLVVLEFSRPEVPVLGRLYRLYLASVLPRLGTLGSGREGPYGYLARTISEFPDAPELAGRIREAGFAAVGWRKLTGGIVAIHTALKAGG
jgi:demethylmenaquinone methyltransferase/2-methoxy-6-polyprenyl-1,4-benzoquinol methylase